VCTNPTASHRGHGRTWTIFFLLLEFLVTPAFGQWRIVSEHDGRQQLPAAFATGGRPIKVGDSLPQDQRFRWLIADLRLPLSISGRTTSGKAIGLQFNCGDGGEVYVAGRLQGRYDNDHPLLAFISDKAMPGEKVPIAVQVYGSVQGGGKFDEATFTLLPNDRTKPVNIVINANARLAAVPDGLIGLSQGGTMADYDDATAAKLKAASFKWFRMDNVLTGALKKDSRGQLVYDWTDFDKRLDFMHKIGAAPILAVSYMPQVLDAVPNNERQSAPRDYSLWEKLCYEAAKRGLERGRRVPYWEVWNEVNAGWLKPGPQDSGDERFAKLYERALGKPEPNREIVRRFESYAKLYRATARGVLRADRHGKIGGPALASGPFENGERGHCQHGRGFARGLMLWCQEEKLPLDFLSWHEYFQSADVIADEADAFRKYLTEFPALQTSVKNLMITEWNEAWWADRPHDHEIGAAWCADGMIRAIIPKQIDKPCLFYAKQGDGSFRGDFGIMISENRPKPTYNVARVFNSLSGHWLKVTGGDDDVCAVAAIDNDQHRAVIVLVNYRFRFPVRRQVEVKINDLPPKLSSGKWRAFTIDSLHSNVFTDASHCELEMTASGSIEGKSITVEQTLLPNSVTMLELKSNE
jgi:hypothetical protein